jgi:hypothetical protein
VSVSIYPCDTEGRPLEGYSHANYANGNARLLLATVGIDAGEYLTGRIEHGELPGIIRTVKVALRKDANGMLYRSPLVRTAEVFGRVVVSWTSDESVCERLASLLHVLETAWAQDAGVAWS